MFFIVKTALSKAVFLFFLFSIFVMGSQPVIPKVKALNKVLPVLPNSTKIVNPTKTSSVGAFPIKSITTTQKVKSLPSTKKAATIQVSSSVSISSSATIQTTSSSHIRSVTTPPLSVTTPPVPVTAPMTVTNSTVITSTSLTSSSRPHSVTSNSSSSTSGSSTNLGIPYKIDLVGPTQPIMTNQSFTISGMVVDSQGNPVVNGTVVSIADGQLQPIVILSPKVGSSVSVSQPSYPSVNASTVTKDGYFSFSQSLSVPGTYNFRVYCNQVDSYLTVAVKG